MELLFLSGRSEQPPVLSRIWDLCGKKSRVSFSFLFLRNTWPGRTCWLFFFFRTSWVVKIVPFHVESSAGGWEFWSCSWFFCKAELSSCTSIVLANTFMMVCMCSPSSSPVCKLVPLFCGSCFQTSATFDQLWSKAIQWKNPETSHSYILTCVQLWVVLGSLFTLSRDVQGVYEGPPTFSHSVLLIGLALMTLILFNSNPRVQ